MSTLPFPMTLNISIVLPENWTPPQPPGEVHDPWRHMDVREAPGRSAWQPEVNVKVVGPAAPTELPQVVTESEHAAARATVAEESAPAPAQERSVDAADISPDELAAERKAELDQFLNALPQHLPAGMGVTADELAGLSRFLHGALQKELTRPPGHAEEMRLSEIARVQVQLDRLEMESRQLRAELTRLQNEVAADSSQAGAQGDTWGDADRAAGSAEPEQSTATGPAQPQSPEKEPAKPQAPSQTTQHPKVGESVYSTVVLPDTCDYTLDMQKVPPVRRKAAVLMAGGATYNEAAAAVGVTRNTVHCWKRTDPGFRALLNSYQNDIQEAAEAKLLSMSDQIVDVLFAHLATGSFRTAIQMAKGLGLLTGQRRELTCELAGLLGKSDSTPHLTPDSSLSAQRGSFNGQLHTTNGHV